MDQKDYRFLVWAKTYKQEIGTTEENKTLN
jgi:hypothetical protein